MRAARGPIFSGLPGLSYINNLPVTLRDSGTHWGTGDHPLMNYQLAFRTPGI